MPCVAELPDLCYTLDISELMAQDPGSVLFMAFSSQSSGVPEALVSVVLLGP